MAFVNNMTSLINKIERRLGTRQLNLPEHLQKDKWAEVVIEDTLTTFSRYFPNKFRYEVKSSDRKGEYYLIDENLIEGITVLGIRDLAWDDNSMMGGFVNGAQYQLYDYFANPYNLEDLALTQMRADELSLFNNGIYIDFQPPNKILLKTCTGIDINLPSFKVDLLIKHSDNLNTISPTKMEVFEELAKADIAVFLYNELKYYDGLETVFATVDIKLSDLQDQAMKREEILEKIKDSYVSASNDNQPLMFTV